MKSGFALFFFKHRSMIENAEYFADHGFESVSILGTDMNEICKNENDSTRLAEIIKTKNITLTVHHGLPLDHSEANVKEFEESIKRVAAWQKKYGLVEVLSFDVYQPIRDNITDYVDFVLENFPDTKVALEDFGLNEDERKQIEHLKGRPNFGYLLDIGHMFIRICGRNHCGVSLATNYPEECPLTENPGFDEFLRAFKSKTFPVFEIHLHNNDGKDDYHYFLDEGNLDCKMIADVLKAIEYDGIVTIESAPGVHFKCDYPESDERALKSYLYWKELNK